MGIRLLIVVGEALDPVRGLCRHNVDLGVEVGRVRLQAISVYPPVELRNAGPVRDGCH